MPVLVDPETVLPEKGRKMTPAQIIMLLLYPVIFVVGLTVGLVIGLKQGREQATAEIQNEHINSTVIPNANNVVNTETVNVNTNANSNTNSLFNNHNQALSNGDYLLIDAATQADLNDQEQADKESQIDQSTSVTDIVRQRDLITVQYRLKAYYAVKGEYPSTSNRQIKLDRTSTDVLYQALKDFYGGSFNEPIDPEYPKYYYGYSSTKSTYELTAWLVSKNKAFIIKE